MFFKLISQVLTKGTKILEDRLNDMYGNFDKIHLYKTRSGFLIYEIERI